MEKAGRKRWGWREGIGLVVGTVAVLGIVVFWPRERLLTEAAHPVTKVNLDRQQLCWLSDRRLLLVTTEQRGDFAPDSNGSLVWSTWKGSADLLDITTHTESHTPALTELFQRTTVFPMERPEEFKASSDGLWILWDTYAGEHGKPLSHVARLDGTHYRKLSDCGSDDSLFVGSNHLVQMMQSEPVMVVCDLQDAAHDRKYGTLKQAVPALVHLASRTPFFSVVSASDKKGGDGYAQIDLYRTEDRLQSDAIWPLGEQVVPKPIQTHSVKLPQGTRLTYERGKTSAQEQAVFYHLQGSRMSPLLAWLHRLIPRYNPKPALTESLWISWLDGKGMRELGQVSTHLDTDGDPEDLIEDVQWLPDGKQISFVYRGMLYVMPATCEE